MSSYNELIALINGCINRNGVQAITGRVLNGVLRAMVNQLGAGYAMGGVAHPTDDPGTPEAPVCYYASEVGTYTHFGNIQIVPGELALLCFDLTDGWFKETMYEGFESVQATIDGNVGTPAVNVTYVNGVLSFDFSNMKGNTGAAAGFGNVTAAVDGTSGTPGVSVQTDGPDTAKNIAFQFTGLKGETGVTSVIATVDNTSGTPQCAVSLNGQQLTLAFTGLKGAQGDTGSSVAYPFTIVNNLTTNDATQALSAAMGVQLEAEVSQLEAKVTDNTNDIDSLQNQLDNYQPIVIEGDVTNAPDEEDITTDENDLLKFANRAAHTNYLGYVILRKGKTFASQVTVPNTIYEIRYDFVLEDDELVTIPSGCELRFNGGSISGGVINLNKALLSGDIVITSNPAWDESDEFYEDYKPKNRVIKVEWFGAKGDGISDDSDSIIRASRFLYKDGAELVFTQGATYIMGDGINDLANDPEMKLHTGYSYSPTSAVMTGNWDGIDSIASYIASHPANIGRRIDLVFYRFKNLKISGNGATIKSHSGNGYCRNNGLFKFFGCSAVEMSGLIVDGNRENRVSALSDLGDYSFGNVISGGLAILTYDSYYDNLSAQNGWSGGVGTRDISCGYREVGNIFIYACENFEVRNVVSCNSLMDGITVLGNAALRSSYVSINGCRISNNSRHNITLAGTRFSKVENCHIYEAGLMQDGVSELYAPTCSNIDSEGEADFNLHNSFVGNTFGKTARNGFVLTLNSRYCKVLQNEFSDGSKGINMVNNRGAYMNEVAFNHFENIPMPFFQEGSIIHDNIAELVDYTGSIYDNSGFVYNDSYVFGVTDEKYISLKTSEFYNNIINCSYTEEPETKPTVGLRFTYNIDMHDNIFNNVLGTNIYFVIYVRRFVNNRVYRDTTTYDWLTNTDINVSPGPFPTGEIEIADNDASSPNYFKRKVVSDYRDYTIRKMATSDLWLQIPYIENFDISIIDVEKETRFTYLNRFGGWAGVVMKKESNVGNSPLVGYYHHSKDSIIHLPTTSTKYWQIHIRIHRNGKTYTNDLSILTSQPDVSSHFQAIDVSGAVSSLPSISPQSFTQAMVIKDKEMLALYDVTTSKYWAVKVSDINNKVSGATADRPTASAVGAGFTYFDTDLGKMIVSNGTAWVNMDGTALS